MNIHHITFSEQRTAIGALNGGHNSESAAARYNYRPICHSMLDDIEPTWLG